MRLSHIIYKVENLEEGIAHFRDQGFHVEYGSKINPHNALIYFSEGPYIELLSKTPLPLYAKVLLKVLGKSKIVERLENWENSSEGIVDLCIENTEDDFMQEEVLLRKHKQQYFKTKSKRLDPTDKLLKWKLLFPFELRVPFLMTYFNIDPKPKTFIHPNGIKRIKSISYGTTATLIPLIRSLCSDERLNLYVGDKIKDLTYVR